MTIALLIMLATISLFRKSSMGHLLLLRAHALLAQVFPGQAAVERITGRDLFEDILRAVVVPFLAQVSGEIAQNLPVGLRARQGSQRAAHSLDVMVNVGHAAIFFRESH